MTISPGQLFLRENGDTVTLVLVCVLTRHSIFEDAGAVVINRDGLTCQFRYFDAERLRLASWQLLECTTEQSEI
jgi:hypothetical protein